MRKGFGDYIWPLVDFIGNSIIKIIFFLALLVGSSEAYFNFFGVYRALMLSFVTFVALFFVFFIFSKRFFKYKKYFYLIPLTLIGFLVVSNVLGLLPDFDLALGISITFSLYLGLNLFANPFLIRNKIGKRSWKVLLIFSFIISVLFAIAYFLPQILILYGVSSQNPQILIDYGTIISSPQYVIFYYAMLIMGPPFAAIFLTQLIIESIDMFGLEYQHPLLRATGVLREYAFFRFLIWLVSILVRILISIFLRKREDR